MNQTQQIINYLLAHNPKARDHIVNHFINTTDGLKMNELGTNDFIDNTISHTLAQLAPILIGLSVNSFNHENEFQYDTTSNTMLSERPEDGKLYNVKYSIKIELEDITPEPAEDENTPEEPVLEVENIFDNKSTS